MWKRQAFSCPADRQVSFLLDTVCVQNVAQKFTVFGIIWLTIFSEISTEESALKRSMQTRKRNLPTLLDNLETVRDTMYVSIAH